VKYAYSLHPLSTVGSTRDIGGRFNIGALDTVRFPIFSALYIAENKDTALQETLGQEPPPPGSGLTAREMALTNAQSEAIVSVSGQLDAVIDLRSPAKLQPLVDLLKAFTLSPSLKREARRLGTPSNLVTTVDELMSAVLAPNWRAFPMRFDVPASSQLFGQLVMIAGVDGIIYPSKLTGGACAAIFPQCVATSGSYLEIDGAVPDPRVPRRIDANTWQSCEKTWNEIIDC
jgi:hypothetical protein